MDSFFQWDPAKYALDVPKMDNGHKGLIASMNKLHHLREAGAGGPDLQRELEHLLQLTVRHFAEEEAFMASIGFPGLPNHKRIHEDLLQKARLHKERFEASGKLTDEFFNFLRLWLKAHICGIDVKYAAHAREHPVA